MPLQCTLPEAAEVISVVASQLPGHAHKLRSGQNEAIDTTAIGDASEEFFSVPLQWWGIWDVEQGSGAHVRVQ